VGTAGLIFRISVAALTASGCVPAILQINDPTWLAPVMITVLAGLLVTVTGSEVKSWRASRPKRYETPEKIRDFMNDWISQEGRVAIYTRDMSWAQQEERILRLLNRKASAGELTLVLPRHIELSRRLEARGATVYTYPGFEYEPKSRFTVVRFGREDAEVAIGRQISGVHTISTYSAGHHSAFALVEDLLELIRRAGAAD
jgi:hypothetical protein